MKNSLELSEMHRVPLHLSTNEGLGLKEWGISAQVQLSAFSGNPPLRSQTPNRHPTGREIVVTACCRPGDPKRVSLRTTVYRVAKLLT